MAHYSKDERMVAALRQEIDLHTATAAEVFNVGLDQVTKMQRGAAKGLNFAMIFGVGDKRLARYLKGYLPEQVVTDAMAAEWKQLYFKKFSGVRVFMRKVMDTIRLKRMVHGHHIQNSFGRVRRLLPSKAYTGINHLIQGWAADLCKASMVRVHEQLGLTFRQNIHDAVRIDLPLKNGKHNIELIKEVDKLLTDWPGVRVPIKTELEWFKDNWGNIQKLKL